MFVVNSRLGLFSATSFSSYRTGNHLKRLPFSRSYGDILPSSLTRVFPRTLEFSSCLPVSVYGTGTLVLARSFSWQRGSISFAVISNSSPSLLRLFDVRICLYITLRAWTRSSSRARNFPSASLRCSNELLVVLECLPVVHRLRFLPRLRSRLTLRRRALLRNP